jgi:transposase-like protein
MVPLFVLVVGAILTETRVIERFVHMDDFGGGNSFAAIIAVLESSHCFASVVAPVAVVAMSSLYAEYGIVNVADSVGRTSLGESCHSHAKPKTLSCYTVGMNLQRQNEPAAVPLPLWQRRLVALVSSGVGPREASEQLSVSWASVDKYTRSGGPFADALRDAEAGVLIVGIEATRDIAVAHAQGLVVDAVTESRDRDNAARERLANRRLVLEVAGAAPGRGVTVNVMTNVGFSRFDNRARPADVS